MILISIEKKMVSKYLPYKNHETFRKLLWNGDSMKLHLATWNLDQKHLLSSLQSPHHDICEQQRVIWCIHAFDCVKDLWVRVVILPPDRVGVSFVHTRQQSSETCFRAQIEAFSLSGWREAKSYVYWSFHFFVRVRIKGPKTMCSFTPRMRSQTQ